MREKFHPLPPEGERFDSTEEESHPASLFKGRSKLFRIQHQISAHAHSIETGIDIHDFTGNAVCPR